MSTQLRCACHVNAPRISSKHLVLACALALSGCLADDTILAPGITPLVSPVEVQFDGRVITPNDFAALPDGSLLVEGTDPGEAGMPTRILLLVHNDGRASEVIGDGGEIGRLRSVSTSGNISLVLGESGVFAIQDGTLFQVPLESMLDVTEIRAVTAVARRDSPGLFDWLVATNTGLSLVAGDTVRPLLANGVPLSVDHLAARGPGAAWASDSEGLLRITLPRSSAMGPTMERLARTGDVQALASDGDGAPWWVEDGQLFSMTRDGRVIARALPAPSGSLMQGISALPAANELWVHVGMPMETTTSALFHFDGSVFRPIDGSFTNRTLRCASASECVSLDSTSGRIERWRIRHDAQLEGLTANASLHDRTEIRITPEAPTLVASIEARVGEMILPVTSGGISLTPSDIGFGARTLVVTITWTDGTLPLVLRRAFVSQAAATWVEDVEPIYQAQCGDCHGAAGPSPRRLDTREDWMREYPRVRPAIEGGAMPLGRPALSPEAVALVQAWADAGFPE